MLKKKTRDELLMDGKRDDYLEISVCQSDVVKNCLKKKESERERERGGWLTRTLPLTFDRETDLIGDVSHLIDGIRDVIVILQEVEDTQAEHIEGNTRVSMIIEGIQKGNTQTRQGRVMISRVLFSFIAHLRLSGSFSLIVFRTLISNRAASRYLSTFLMIFSAKRVFPSLVADRERSSERDDLVAKSMLTHEDHELQQLCQKCLRQEFDEFHLRTEDQRRRSILFRLSGPTQDENALDTCLLGFTI